MAELEDNTKFYLIDYEYGWWNPRYYDLGNYLNEWICDNAHPAHPGIFYYYSNWPTDDEIEAITREYWTLYTGGKQEWSLKKKECSKALTQTKSSMILNNFYWAVWAIMMLPEEDETDPDGYTWEFISGRAKMHHMCVEQFGFGAI